MYCQICIGAIMKTQNTQQVYKMQICSEQYLTRYFLEVILETNIWEHAYI